MPEEVPKSQPTPETPKPSAEPGQVRHISHSYQDDLSQAMNATDASIIQEMLHEARDREESAKIETKNTREKKWYTAVSLTLIVVAILAAGYGVYHYMNLTVPVVEKISVGVFPSTTLFSTDTASVEGIITTITTDETLKPLTPYLVPIVNSTTNALLTNKELFKFLEIDTTEPFESIFDSVRLGAIRIDDKTMPFFIGSVADPVVATKEFLIAEPELLRMFYRALNIDPSTIPSQIGNTFTQEYRYNLPVRILSYTEQNGNRTELFFYGFATNNILVMATDSLVLETISNNIIRQQ